MTLIFTSYASAPEYNQPGEWLKRIEGYTGILESLSHNHKVIGIERINYEGEYTKEGVQYYFIRQKNKVVHFPWRMHRMIKNLKPDAVFINGFIFPAQVFQLRLQLGSAVKIIIIHRSEKPFEGLKKYVQNMAYRCANAYLFTSSEFGKQWIENGNVSNQKKVYEVFHGSSVFKCEDKVSAKSAVGVTGSPLFLWVGRLDNNKDPLTVLKGFAAFLNFQPLAKLYMIYHTEELLQDVNNFIQQDKKTMQAVSLIGKIAHEQLQHWYNSADFIISGSHYEGGGIAVVEALSCGCIPVITDIKSFRKITGPGKCGLLYKPGDHKDLLMALMKTTAMDIDKERAKVLQQFNEEFSFEAIANKMNTIIAAL